MKRIRKRDPRTEPFASAISDDYRHHLVNKAVADTLDEHESKTLFDDFDRAHKKGEAARQQRLSPMPADTEFADPQAREASAQASVGTMLSAVRYLGESGSRARRGWKNAAKHRHKFSEESVNHKSWDQMRAQILRDWTLPRKPSDRRIAMLIESRHQDHPSWETIRGYFKRQKKKVG